MEPKTSHSEGMANGGEARDGWDAGEMEEMEGRTCEDDDAS